MMSVDRPNLFAFIRQARAEGIDFPVFILGGGGELNWRDVRAANPKSLIIFRQAVEYALNIYDYRPREGIGWLKSTRQQGYEFAADYYRKYLEGRGFEHDPGIIVQWHNEPTMENGDGGALCEGFIEWTHGTLDFAESKGLRSTVGNWSGGIRALDEDPEHQVWQRPDIVALFRRVKAGNHVLNFHQGSLLGDERLDNVWDSLRHRVIRQRYLAVAPDLVDLQIVSTEFYIKDLRAISAETLLTRLRQLIPKMVEDRLFWLAVFIWTAGTPSGLSTDIWYGDDVQNKYAALYQAIKELQAALKAAR